MAYSERADELKQRKASEWAKSDQQQLDDAAKALLQHRNGRRYLDWLLTLSNAWGAGEMFTGNALTTAFNCGAQNVGKQIMAHLMEVSPRGFLELVQESANERTERHATYSRTGDPARDGGQNLDGAGPEQW